MRFFCYNFIPLSILYFILKLRKGEDMKKFGIYTVIVLIVTIILPTVIVKTFKFVPMEDKFNIDSSDLKGNKRAAEVDKGD